MQFEEKVVVLLGRTGDGKSSAGNLVVRCLSPQGQETNPFSEGASTQSHTADPLLSSAGGVKVVDTPGLVDSNGPDRDERNIINIVAYLKTVGVVHGFVLVLNEQAVRFDFALKNAVKLLVDTFGPQMLSQFGILFTRSNQDAVEQRKFVQTEIIHDIEKLTGVVLKHIPFWQIDCHPERLRCANTQTIEIVTDLNIQAVQQLRRWLSSLTAFDVSNTVAERYEQTKIEEELRLKAEEERLNSIDPARTVNETQEVETGRSQDASSRYGPKEFGAFGGRKYKDHWTNVSYRTETRSIFYKVNGEEHSRTPWQTVGQGVRQEGRWTQSYF